MKKIIQNNILLILFFVTVLIYFYPTFLHGLLPIPADTIIGLYNPFRDLYAKTNPNGIAYKNFLITDPVRQIYPWKDLVVQSLSKLQLPLWNPYEMAGTPLLANFQSSAFYPLNIVLFLKPFFVGWTIFIMLQPILAGLFLYFYLKNLRLSSPAAAFGGLVFALCGFSVAWLEWGNVVSTILWLPLILLSIDNMVDVGSSSKLKSQSAKLHLRTQRFIWSILFIFSISSALFAGHLQSFFYLFIISSIYFLVRWFQTGRKVQSIVLFLILNSLFLILTAIQWIPTLQFISLSARNVDQTYFNTPGWFLPWQNLVQFFVPDFFGNPTTLNYWGIWNYGEFIGYIGIIPVICAFFALIFRHDKKTWFFAGLLFISLLFALPNPLSQLPFVLNIPFLSTAQPTRLMAIADLSLAVLAAFGFDMILKKRKQFMISTGLVVLLFAFIWGTILFAGKLFPSISASNIAVAKHNSVLPTLFLLAGGIVSFLLFILPKNKKLPVVFLTFLFLISAFDLIRFAQKFESFSPQKYVYPQTSSLSFLQKHIGNYRIAETDSQIFPPNFSVEYHLQSVDGYDPLYLLRYGEFIAASERGKPNIAPPFGFNRILTPHNINSQLMNLLGVKYVLSLTNLPSPHFKKVFQEGTTMVFENTNVFPRAFTVQTVNPVNTNDEAIRGMFDPSIDLHSSAIVEKYDPSLPTTFASGSAHIVSYLPKKVSLETQCSGKCFVILTDSEYPTWQAKVDGTATQIYTTDYNFRGIIVLSGKHTVEFSDHLF